jgi:hypothetical protein
MIAFLLPVAATTQFAAGWHVENRVLWIVLGIVLIIVLMAAYLLIRTKWGHADRPRSRHSARRPQ